MSVLKRSKDTFAQYDNRIALKRVEEVIAIRKFHFNVTKVSCYSKYQMVFFAWPVPEHSEREKMFGSVRSANFPFVVIKIAFAEIMPRFFIP